MTRFAFFIGVAKYEDDTFPSYESVRNSADDLHRLFDGSDLWTVSPLIEDPATPDEVIDPIATALEESRPGDAVLVYFAGHGRMSRRSDQYMDLELVMRRSKRASGSNFLELHKLFDVLKQCTASQLIVILDCCDSGRLPSLGTDEETISPERMERAIGLRQMRDHPTTYVLTPLRPDDPEQSAHATRDSPGTAYTAFSGALIDLLSEGIPGAPEVLDVEQVFAQIHERLEEQGHPLPEVRKRGTNQVPLLENGPRSGLDAKTRKELSQLSIAELGAEWAYPHIASRRAAAQFVGELVRDSSEGATEFVHALHRKDHVPHGEQSRVVHVILSGPVDSCATTTGLLLNRPCAECATVGRRLLTEAARTWGSGRLGAFRRALGPAARASFDDALVDVVPLRQLGALTEDLLSSPRADTDGAGAFELLEGVGAARAEAEVRQLLRLLAAETRALGADAVLDGIALRREPEDIGCLAVQLADLPGVVERIDDRIARQRSAHDLAAYAAAVDDETRVKQLLRTAAESRPFDALIRLAAALRGRERPSVALEAVDAALSLENTGCAAAKALEGLPAHRNEWRSGLVGVVAQHLGERVPWKKLAPFFFQHDDREELVDTVVTMRDITDLVNFYREAVTDGPEGFASEIASRIGRRRTKSADLKDFVRDADVGAFGPAEDVFRQLSIRTDGDTISNMLGHWHAVANRPERLRDHDDALIDYVAGKAESKELLQVASLLVGNAKQELARRLIHHALKDQPARFTAQQLADLLAWWSANSSGRGSYNIRRNGLEALQKLSRSYQDEDRVFRGDGGVVATQYFAELVAATRTHPGISGNLASQIETLTADSIAERGTRAILYAYADKLNEVGMSRAAKRFIERVEL